jgi:TrmH family RNA methyltransferase
MNIELTKKQIAEIKSLYTKHGRKKSSFCVVEGVRGCEEIFNRMSHLVEYVVISDSYHGKTVVPSNLKCYVVKDSIFSSLSGTVTNQGILAIVKVPEEEEVKVADDFIVALDRIGDPGNFGTICRTVKSANLNHLWYTKGSVDPFNDKVIRSAMAAQFLLKLREFETLEDLRNEAIRQGFTNICLSKPASGASCFTAENIYNKSIMVIGSEGQGVSDVSNAIDIKIPMPGNFESLNAAQAATILIFEYVRRKEANLKL